MSWMSKNHESFICMLFRTGLHKKKSEDITMRRNSIPVTYRFGRMFNEDDD